MGKTEALQKKIDQIADRVKHLRYILIALMSSIIGVVFGISQDSVKVNIIIEFLLIIGTIGVFSITLLIKKEENQRNKLIEQLDSIKE